MELAVIRDANPLTEDLVARIGTYIEASTAPNTRRAYRAAWAAFVAWCDARMVIALPATPVTVAAFLADQAGALKVSTLAIRMAAIARAHELTGSASPTRSPEVSLVLKGIRRTLGTARSKKAALVSGDVKAIAGRLPNTAIGLRDRALLLLGFAAGLRRSELVGLDLADVQFVPEGLVVRISRSKTDQEARGWLIGIGHGSSELTCPVTALRRWLAIDRISSGPLFRPVDRHGHVRSGRLSTRSVARLVKKLGALVGLQPQSLAGHSLRSGFVSPAARAGLEEHAIARVTGHRSTAVLRGYVQDSTVFEGDTVRRLGL